MPPLMGPTIKGHYTHLGSGLAASFLHGKKARRLRSQKMTSATPASSCGLFWNRSPLFAPVVRSSVSACRYKDVVLRRHANTGLAHVCKSYMPAPYLLSSSSRSKGTGQGLHSGASSVKRLKHPAAATSIQFLGCDLRLSNTSPVLCRQSRSVVPVRAYKDDLFKFSRPVITEKPEWWWRTLACVPYLIALQISDTGYYLQPFLEHYESLEDLIYFVPGAIKRLPIWFSMVYCYFAYIGIVKNKDWPHFFRFHLMMGMLLETALQIVWYTSNFMPLIHYSGRFGMHYWAAVGFAYIFILLECIRCAVGGIYAHIPLVSDAAYIHTLFNIGGYHRPF